jgi:hypothetical protein
MPTPCWIPDPVAPWLESDRREERFRHVLLLQTVHTVLQLKPLVDADLPYPPMLVFPSWEKLLEENDPQTRRGIEQLVTDVLARFVDPGIEAFSDAVELARRQPDLFIAAVDRGNLFVAPGGLIGEPVLNSISRYENEMETWRSAEWLRGFRTLSPSMKLLNGLLERLGPQYHVLENSEELGAHPLFCIEQQAHYFKIIAQTNSERLEKSGLLKDRSRAMLDGLGSERLNWLSDVPIDTLIRLSV